jgi:ABC transporter fused permease/ATP-binding protein
MARGSLNSGSASAPELEKAKINKSNLKKVLRLLRYVKPYRTKFFFGLAFLLLSSITSLAFPAAMGKLIDAATGTLSEGIFTNINTIAIVLIGILAVQALFSFFRILWFVEVAEKSLADIRKDTYLKLISLPMNFFANRRVGELNSRISADLSQIQDTITTSFAEIIRQIIVFIGGTIALSIVSGKLTLLMLSILPVLIVVAVVFGRYIRKLSKKAQDNLAESNTVVEETLQGISNVKSFTNELYESQRYNVSIDNVVKIALKGATFRGAFASFIIFCLFGAIVTVVWYGSNLVSQGLITVGDLTTFILYSTFVGAAMGSFAELYSQLQKAVGASERVLEILEEDSEAIDFKNTQPHKKFKGDVAFENVEFSYPSRSDIQVLSGVSFEIESGQRVAIVGQSGAGKSTIANLLLQFYHSNKGKILFDGIPSTALEVKDIRENIAIVPQDVFLFGGTILENIQYGNIEASFEEVQQAAKRANAHHFISQFPEKYETVVGERGVKLSGGQKQRIAIARALLKNPAILILDEATSSLDSESERLVQDALEELMKNRTSIIIAHRLSTIRACDKILVLDKGHIIEKGTHEELILNEHGLYKHLSELQLA